MNAFPATNYPLATPRRAALAVFACWFAISAFAIPLIVHGWSVRGDVKIGVNRAIAFEIAFSCICGAGYLLYRRQSSDQTIKPRADSWDSKSNAKPIRSAVCVGVAIQMTFLVLAAMILDGGRLLHVAKVATVAYWSMLSLIYLRRSKCPTRLDELAIRYGFIPILLLVGRIGPIVWQALGHW